MRDHDRQALVEALRMAASLPKSIGRPVGWTMPGKEERGARPNDTRLTVSLAMASDVPVELHGRADVRRPDGHVEFMLMHPWRSHLIKCGSVSWRPPAPHLNREGPADLRGLKITGSHYHPLDLNLRLGIDRMVEGRMPVARPIDPEPKDFNDLLIQVGALFSILDTGLIGQPEWSPTLF